MNVAVLGYGTVGSGVVEVLEKNKNKIGKKVGNSLDVKYILDKREFLDSPIKEKFVNDINIILEDEEVKIVAEAMGGVSPAYEYVKMLLESGKSVVTSNKELVAMYGPELLEIAHNKKVNFLFEASVGGGIPIIRPLNSALTADEVMEITGILNGTTNFILTKMRDEKRSFEDVLKEAQQLGYAERNPEADVEGHDACRKIAILSSLAFEEHVDFKEITTEGITKITSRDMDDAALIGCEIKLLGSCKKQGENIFASVEPTMISKEHPLAMVSDVFNAILVNGNMVGDLMFYGRGAGKLPTASAMVADMIDAARHDGVNITVFWSKEKVKLSNIEDMVVAYFVRLDGDVNLAKILVKELFGDVEEVASKDGYVFVTPHEKKKDIESKLNNIKDCNVVTKIRIEK
ncbi:MAG: homoserine dehydrogenase [Cellulosilyticaceae bacterium]